jgi:hypothetical protein
VRMGDSAEARQMWWEGLPRWEHELRMLAALWPPTPVLPRPKGRIRHHGPRDPGPPPSYIHPSVARRYLRPLFGHSLGGFTREGYSADKFFNSYIVVLPEEKTSAKRRGKRLAGQGFSMVLGGNNLQPVPAGRREFLNPFHYRSADELLRRVVEEVDEHLAPLRQAPGDQLLRTFVREYVKRNASFPGATEEMDARLASRRNVALKDWVSDDDARAFLKWVRIPRALRRELRGLATGSVDVAHVAGVLLYMVAAVGTFWWRLRALDDESARRRGAVLRDLRAFTSTRNRIEAEWGLSKETLGLIDTETASLRDCLKLLKSVPDTKAVRWALRMYRARPVREWGCWTPVAVWLMNNLPDPLAFATARLLNVLTARSLNAAVENPFCAEPKVRWPLRPMWSRKQRGPAWNADALRQRFYRSKKARNKKIRATANREQTLQEVRPAAN